MKTYFTFILIFFIFSTGYSQVTTDANTSTTPTIDYVGWDSGIGNPLRIKHENNYGIEFYTNTGAGTFGIPKMELESTGELGIGTTTPASWLHVENTSEDEMFRTNGATGSLWRMLTGGTSRMNIFHMDNTGSGTGHDMRIESTTGQLHLASLTSFAMRFFTNNSERMRITDGGFVGIGTPSPSSRLHVNGAGNPTYLTVSNAASPTGFKFGIAASTDVAEIRQQEDAAMIFYTGLSGGSATERMRIFYGGTNEGRVGIMNHSLYNS